MNSKFSLILRVLAICGFVFAMTGAGPAGAFTSIQPKLIRFPGSGLQTILVTPPGDPTTTEGSGTATISIVLDSAPIEGATVTIPVSSSNEGEGTVNVANLVFTSEDYTTPQEIIVAGQDDFIDDGDIPYSVVLGEVTGGDPAYDGQNPDDIDITNLDDDTVGVTVNDGGDGATTSETPPGTDTFTIVLNAQPSAGSVSIDLTSSSPDDEGNVSPASVNFNTADWNSPVEVTVTGVDDAIADGPQPYTIVTANAVHNGGGEYDGLEVVDVSATNTDDDSAGITVDEGDGVTTSETAPGTDSFTVVLTSEPAADVTIGVSSLDTGEGTVSPSSLTFTGGAGGNWATPQSVTVTGVDDAIADGGVSYTVQLDNPTGDDPAYNAINPPDVTATNTDNDTAGITVTPTSGLETTEGAGTDTFTVVLNSEPIADVTIAVSSLDTGEGTVSPASLTFAPTDWFDTQTVTVTGVNDDVADGPAPYTVRLANPTGGDATYNGINPDDVSVTNQDNDTAGITVDVGNGVTTSEPDISDSFSIVLTSEPTNEVTINLGLDDSSEGSLPETTHVFSGGAGGNWSDPWVVTVEAVDDDQIDGPQDYSITVGVSTEDPNYSILPPVDPVSVTNQDDDVPAILIEPIDGLITKEDGTTAQFTAVLDSEPGATVTLPLQSSDTTEGIISIDSLTFTPGNWDEPQPVTITGVDDDLEDGQANYSIITGDPTSTDLNYGNLTAEDVPDVSVANADDDTAGITISPSANLVTTEGQGEATINIVLNTLPEADVVFTLSSDDPGEGTFDLENPDLPATLTFSPSNWATIQSVVLRGVDDLKADGDISYGIQVVTQSSDTLYDDKAQELSAVNKDAPTIDWVKPENHDPYYETSSLEPILLGVEPLSEEPLSYVRFYRWDPSQGKNVTLFEDEIAPYEFYLDPQELDLEFNQIYAYAVDDDGDQTQSKHVLLRIFRLAALYLPIMNK